MTQHYTKNPAAIEALSPEQYYVTQENGTERPFSGEYSANKEPGIYVDIVSGEPLFASIDKFESGTGWPSFYAPFDERHVTAVRDTSYGMVRIETRCARCDSHQGHLFPDGPPPTRLRYCINSVSLQFVRDGDPLPDPLHRGDRL
jgi:peptide-methionine (R)-S-oxide reductase